MTGTTSEFLRFQATDNTSDYVGWRAVVRNPRIPPGKATIVKVPHHGSAGADHPPVWTTMIDNDASVGVTSFNSSKLPRPTDLARLRGRTVRVFHASPKAPAIVRLDRATERTLEGVGIRERSGDLGHIRFRVIDGAEVACRLFGAARAV